MLHSDQTWQCLYFGFILKIFSKTSSCDKIAASTANLFSQQPLFTTSSFFSKVTKFGLNASFK